MRSCFGVTSGQGGPWAKRLLWSESRNASDESYVPTSPAANPKHERKEYGHSTKYIYGVP
jgi:hypothetical protein